MTASFTPEVFGDAIIIRYDGLDADRHEIDMALLVKSLRGLSKIISAAGNFAATQKYIQDKDSLVLKAVVTPPKSHCFEIAVWLHWINQNPLICTVVGGLSVSLVTYIFQKAAGNKEEMKQIRGALDVAIRELGARDDATVNRLLDTVDRMAESLRPSVRQAVAPIEQTARTITIKNESETTRGVFGGADKEAILSEVPVEVGPEAVYSLRFTEMDVETGTCKVSLDPTSTSRTPAKITDPALAIPNNKYVLALAAQTIIEIMGKPTLRDGGIEKLFISNTV